MADTKIDLRAMQQRVDDLGARIGSLRQRVKTGTNRAQQLQNEFAALEARHRELSEAMATAQGTGARPEHHSLVHKLTDDLDASVAKFTDWVDAEEHPGAPPPSGFSP
jgi:cell division septum initiation protein DivIVA